MGKSYTVVQNRQSSHIRLTKMLKTMEEESISYGNDELAYTHCPFFISHWEIVVTGRNILDGFFTHKRMQFLRKKCTYTKPLHFKQIFSGRSVLDVSFRAINTIEVRVLIEEPFHLYDCQLK